MKEEIKKLLRESITVYEAKEEESDKEVKDSEEDKKDSDKKERDKEERDKEEGHKEKYVSKGEQDDLKKLAKPVYDYNLGQELSDCALGSDKNRTNQSKLRKYMLGDPYKKNGNPDVGRTPKKVANKVISCLTDIRSDLGKV